jgi:hypothetical protein
MDYFVLGMVIFDTKRFLYWRLLLAILYFRNKSKLGRTCAKLFRCCTLLR